MHTTQSSSQTTLVSYEALIQTTREFLAGHPGVTPELIDSIQKKQAQARQLGINPDELPSVMFDPALSDDVVAKAALQGFFKPSQVRQQRRI